MFKLDTQVEQFNKQAYDTPLIKDIWKGKYLQKKLNEVKPEDVYRRVAKAIATSPTERKPLEAETIFYEMMVKRLFVPGGRILAGAGTNKRVTLMNCYVNETIDDSMEGIVEAYKNLMLTSQQGGGMGTAFETIRPLNAILARTQSAASGPLPFMDTFNEGGKCVRSAGDRRAAQMGTISDTHPDMPEFVRSKGEGLKDGSKRFAEFNLSVLISDAFKAAVDDDAEWLLYFHIPPIKRDPALEEYDFEDEKNVKQYVYSIWRARDLWELITKYTYEYNDPGVIFIDRINDMNNLSYCETIRCTNPCGEQPLPPNGTCNLGAINVANVVVNPFSSMADVNYSLLAEVATHAVRFLDNVIEVTQYPLKAQEQEEFNKRRIGLGLLGLGTLFSELRIRYGSVISTQVAEKVMKTICLAAYKSSMALASERGKFPMFQDIIVDCGFISYRLPQELKDEIAKTGLRNGVILTIAPTGTGAIACGNVSSGLEPDFAHEYERKVRSNNTEEYDTYVEKSYTKRFYEYVTGETDTPSYMVTAFDLSVLDHIRVQGAIQKWVDASTSKTINIDPDTTYEEFLEVYELAYQFGCKGCTTYRPNALQGSILSTIKAEEPQPTIATQVPELVKRPNVLSGHTYKIKWPSMSASIYITINYMNDKPHEIFFASKDAKYQDWMTGLTLMISSILRNERDPSFIVRELKQVVSTHDTQWHNGKFYGSLVSRIGAVIEEDFILNGVIKTDTPQVVVDMTTINPMPSGEKQMVEIIGERCTSCGAPAVIHKEGCKSCQQCGHSECG